MDYNQLLFYAIYFFEKYKLPKIKITFIYVEHDVENDLILEYHYILVQLNLFDQIPISQDSEIEVTVDEISAASHNLLTGQVQWIVNLAPGESTSYKLGFTIKYSKEKEIKVQTFRTVACPSF